MVVTYGVPLLSSFVNLFGSNRSKDQEKKFLSTIKIHMRQAEICVKMKPKATKDITYAFGVAYAIKNVKTGATGNV